MQNVINPTFSIPLESSPGGSIVEPGFEIAGSPPSVFVAEAVWNESWWQWFWWHAPTFAVIAFIVIGIPLALRIRRIVRAKQEVGKWYCPRCNHLLAEPHIRVEEKNVLWAAEESRCPECGDRSAKGPRAGRLIGPRIKYYLLPLWLLGSLMMFVVPSNLGWQKQAWRAPSGTWPIAGLEPVFGPWAIQRQKALESVQGWRYWKVDPISHETTVLGTVASSNATQIGFVSPDGKFIVTPSENSDTLLLIDTNSKAQRRVALGSGMSLSWTSLHVLGYTDDSRTAFVERTSLFGQSDELFGIDMQSGAVTSIAVSARSGSNVGMEAHSFGTFVVKMGEKEPVWVHTESISHHPQRASEKYVRWTRNGRSLEKFIDTDGDMSIVSVLPHADAVSIEPRSGKTRFYSLETGEEIERPKPTAVGSRPVRRLRVMQDSKIGSAIVQDMKGNVLGTVKYLMGSQSYPKRSEDGRFFVASGGRKVNGPLAAWMPGVPQVDASEVLVWDFENLIAAESESAARSTGNPAGN